MSKLMVRITCGLLVMLVVIGGLAGCSSPEGDTTDTDEPEYAGPIVEGLLQSLIDGDYQTHLAYYDPEVQSSIVEDDFLASTQAIKDAIGDYIDKEYQETAVEGVYIAVYYIAHFTDEPDDVEVAVYLQEIDGEMYVAGFWLSSPKLLESVEE